MDETPFQRPHPHITFITSFSPVAFFCAICGDTPIRTHSGGQPLSGHWRTTSISLSGGRTSRGAGSWGCPTSRETPTSTTRGRSGCRSTKSGRSGKSGRRSGLWRRSPESEFVKPSPSLHPLLIFLVLGGLLASLLKGGAIALVTFTEEFIYAR